jgi:hypothetical protein
MSIVFIKRRGRTDTGSYPGHGLSGYGLDGLDMLDGLRRVEFGVMTLTHPLTRRVERGGYGQAWIIIILNSKILK